MKYINGILGIMILVLLSVNCSDVSTVSGNVYDYDSGEPVSGAAVTLCFSNEASCPDNAADDTDVTDRNGHYSVRIDDEPVAGTYNSMTVSKDGYIPFSDNLEMMKDHDLSVYLKSE